MKDPYYDPWVELYHYGVKGMKWGERKDDDRKEGDTWLDALKRKFSDFGAKAGKAIRSTGRDISKSFSSLVSKGQNSIKKVKWNLTLKKSAKAVGKGRKVVSKIQKKAVKNASSSSIRAMTKVKKSGGSVITVSKKDFDKKKEEMKKANSERLIKMEKDARAATTKPSDGTTYRIGDKSEKQSQVDKLKELQGRVENKYSKVTRADISKFKSDVKREVGEKIAPIKNAVESKIQDKMVEAEIAKNTDLTDEQKKQFLDEYKKEKEKKR